MNTNKYADLFWGDNVKNVKDQDALSNTVLSIFLIDSKSELTVKFKRFT